MQRILYFIKLFIPPVLLKIKDFVFYLSFKNYRERVKKINNEIKFTKSLEQKYLIDLKTFEKLGGTITKKNKHINDYYDTSGNLTFHYFYQDLLIASFIHKKNPNKHVDVGSRIDGFVAHVASFRKIEIFDIRPFGSLNFENISYFQCDLMDESTVPQEYTDSLSCLHTIEHFGLGRYNDPIDPQGHIKGFNNLFKMLKPNGTLYISFPITNNNEIHFNAHRIFHPQDIFKWVSNNHKIELIRFDYIDDNNSLFQNIEINNVPNNLKFGCGIYTIKKH